MREHGAGRELGGRVDGLAACLDTHFRHERLQLNPVLDLLDRDPSTATPVGALPELVLVDAAMDQPPAGGASGGSAP